MWIFSYIIYPTNYLRIWVEIPGAFQSKFHAEIVIPAIISTLLTVIYFIMGQSVLLIGPSGIFSSVADLCQLLAAFFLAALAAIATFGNPHLDKGLRGGAAKIYRWNNSLERREPVELTRRAFLSNLYGYLAWVSIIFFICISIFEACADIEFPINNYLILNAFNYFLIFFASFLFIHIIFVSIIGIVFLIDRINDERAKS